MLKSKEKNIVLAFFDILGTSKLLNDGKYDKVYDFYLEMIKLCCDSRTPIAVRNPMYGKRDVIANLPFSDVPYHIINYDLNHAFFSDTFLMWIELNEFLQPTLLGFLEKCCIIFCEAVRKGIPLRGVISIGSAVMDTKNRVYLGMPLAEAAKAEPQQNWIGIGLGRSIQKIHEMDIKYLIPYFNHRKERVDPSNSLLGGWVLDWYSWWSHNYSEDVSEYIKLMDTDEKFSSYYNNCLSFVEVSKQRDVIWKLYMLFSDLKKVAALCAIDTELDAEQLQMRTQGIEMFLSDDLKKWVNFVLNMDTSLWLDEKSRNVLLDLQNDVIEIGGEKHNLKNILSV